MALHPLLHFNNPFIRMTRSPLTKPWLIVGMLYFVTKVLLIAAWSLSSLSGSVFFGAFNSMRDKFGTNERKIENVLEKRDWEAFSEMLEFGYRMNRFDRKSERSALTTFLDRVPSDKFFPEQVDEMIVLGANINDQSKDPRDEDDNLEEDKIGDNVIIRYVKFTPWYALLTFHAYSFIAIVSHSSVGYRKS